MFGKLKEKFATAKEKAAMLPGLINFIKKDDANASQQSKPPQSQQQEAQAQQQQPAQADVPEPLSEEKDNKPSYSSPGATAGC